MKEQPWLREIQPGFESHFRATHIGLQFDSATTIRRPSCLRMVIANGR